MTKTDIEIATGLALEYKRIGKDWCNHSDQDSESARTAIFCAATRLNVYPLFIELLDKQKGDQ